MASKIKSLRLTEADIRFIKNHEGKFTCEELSYHLWVFPSTIKKFCKKMQINILHETKTNADGEELFNINEYIGYDLYI